MKIFVFTGAGISAESGLQTFRASDGLWEEHKIQDVATVAGWNRNKQLVLDFYNARRKAVKEAEPNAAHLALAELEKYHDVTVVTQNIDDLHERAGSTKVIHLHGNIFTVKSEHDDGAVYDWFDDLKIGDVDDKGTQLRPNIVWFGESVPNYSLAYLEARKSDILIVIGTSAKVYPAADLITVGAKDKFYIDLDIPYEFEERGFFCFREKASEGVPKVLEILKNYNG